MKTLYVVLLLQLFLFFGCDDNSIDLNDGLFGLYEASTFIEPGPLDGGVDIISSGGYLKISFNDDFRFSAEMFIPQYIGSNHPGEITNYNGSYTIVNNMLKFNPPFIVDELIWDKENKMFISKEAPLRGRPFKIILHKNIK